MRKGFALLTCLVAFAAEPSVAQKPTTVLGPGLGAGRTSYVQNFDRTLSKDTVYILTGIYIVDSTYTLAIPAGTTILGDTVATLFVARGGKVMADGTKDEPIIMSSRRPVGQRAAGDWGGVIILGAAPTNRATEPVIEGGVGGLGGAVGSKAYYGGTDPSDNSGVFRFVRIEYPGYRFSPNNEINGLTMGGVGNGTTIEHVQVSYSLDDAFEWFGGTVNAKYLIALGSQDDDFDTDFGYRGNLQFLLALKDPNRWDSDASNGFESDNDGSGTGALPYTSAVWSNVTVIGPLRVDGSSLPAGSNHQDGLRIRRNSQLKIYNSIVMGFPNGVNVPDSVTGANAVSGAMVLKNTSVQAGSAALKSHASFAIVTWFNAVGSSNLGGTTRAQSALGLTDIGSLTNPDPRPTPGSEPTTAGTSFADTPVSVAFFLPVSYRGAFDPSKGRTQQWDYGWANYNPQMAHYNNPVGILGPGLGAGRTSYLQNFNRTLSKDTLYTLTGIYIVDSTYSLTIPPGTRIEGDTVATLFIARGGRIYASGTKDEPIVLTSRRPAGQRAAGDWGGVIILGAAPTNRATEPVIEGGVGGLGGAVGTRAFYGGSIPTDTSGVLRYVRIEYPGYRFSPNNEINGLTMGGVGSGTTIEYVQVSYSLDDGFEWFGGTVNAKYLVAFGSQDDDFDTDYGYRGNLQFLFSLKDPNKWDSDASNGFESDNDGSGTGALPFTSAVWSNVTVVGPLRVNGATLPAGSNHQDGLRIRRNSQLKIANSVVMGFPNGVNVPDSVTGVNAVNGDMMLVSSTVQAPTAPLKSHTSFSIATWFNAAGSNNSGAVVRAPMSLELVDLSDLNNPDPRPAPTSELATLGTSFAAPFNAAFFTNVGYRGAFDPAKLRSEQWDFGWTDYNPNDLVSTPVTKVEFVSNDVPAGLELAQNFPNPFNPSTVIRFTLPATVTVTLKVYDLLGREVALLVNDVLSAGQHQVTFDARSLSSGTYLYVIEAASMRQVKRMTLIK